MKDKLHDIYLPFTEDEIKEHFVQSVKDLDNIKKHISKYKKSIDNYKLFETNQYSEKNIKLIRQIEKDETFWTASSLMTIFHSKNSINELQKLLMLAFGEKPPLDNFDNWANCLNGELRLFFEPNIPSPKGYQVWLKNNVTNRNFIPYIVEHAQNKKNEFRLDLEGPTNVDALLLNITNGFSIFIEAKVLSDISYQVSFDSTRNQIIRNIDVMLSSNNENLEAPLKLRKPENSLFILLTPELFKKLPNTRLYGFKFNEYKTNPISISNELAHRKLNLADCVNISKRIGWTTWEDLKLINSNCCKWFDINNNNENTASA